MADIPDIAAVPAASVGTPMEHADDEAIVSAVNEAAEEVVDEAAVASLDVSMENAKGTTAVPPTSSVSATAEAQPEAHTEEMVTPEAESKENEAAVEISELPQVQVPPVDASATTTAPPPTAAAPETSDPAIVDPAAAAAAIEDPSSATKSKQKPKKETKKRIRRVGKTAPRKIAKTEENTPSSAAPNTPATLRATSGEAATAVAAAQANLVDVPPESMPRVLSKHDEKWNSMFDKLVAYKVRCFFGTKCGMGK